MILALLLGCAPTPVACAPTWDGWAHGFFVSYCESCHARTALDRHGAPVGTSFDTEASVQLQVDAIRRTVLEEGSMPVAGGVMPDDLERLAVYLECVE